MYHADCWIGFRLFFTLGGVALVINMLFRGATGLARALFKRSSGAVTTTHTFQHQVCHNNNFTASGFVDVCDPFVTHSITLAELTWSSNHIENNRSTTIKLGIYKS